MPALTHLHAEALIVATTISINLKALFQLRHNERGIACQEL